jgi:thiol:disulfide interchange protein
VRALAAVVSIMWAVACSGGAADTTSGPGATRPDIAVVNQPGEDVVIEDVLVAGKVTVVDFYADWCGACKVIERNLVPILEREPTAIALRKIDIKDAYTPVARRYGIEMLPHVRVFTASGELHRILVGNAAMSTPEIAQRLLDSGGD